MLEPWLDPEVLGAGPGVLGAPEFHTINRWTTWDCLLSPYLAMTGKKGQGPMMVTFRFQAITNGDWSRLLEMLDLDWVRQQKRKEVRRWKARGRGPQEEDMDHSSL